MHIIRVHFGDRHDERRDMRAQGGPYRACDRCEATRGLLIQGSADVCFDAISTDSRDIRIHDFFVPLRGAQFDGHDFLLPAYEAGARGSLVAADVYRETLPKSSDFVLIQVQDTLLALSDLASAHRRQYHAPLIAVTGSSGKTTTKEMIAAILRVNHRPLVSPGNLNNLIGLPMTLLNLSGSHTAAVVEAGINTTGEMAVLAKAARPDVAIITNIGPVHLEGLGSIRGVAEEKFKLVEALSSSGTAVLPHGQAELACLLDGCRAKVITFGIEEGDFRAERVSARETIRFVMVSPEGETAIEMAVPGRHNVANALAAAAACSAVGVGMGEVAEGLGRFEPPSWRMETVRLRDGRTVIRDVYNANPQSVEAALRALADYEPGSTKMAVLADMMELGERSGELHRAVGKLCADMGIDHCVFVGSYGASFAEGFLGAGGPAHALTTASDREQAWEVVKDKARNFRTILIKGSRRMRMELFADMILQEN